MVIQKSGDTMCREISSLKKWLIHCIQNVLHCTLTWCTDFSQWTQHILLKKPQSLHWWFNNWGKNLYEEQHFCTHNFTLSTKERISTFYDKFPDALKTWKHWRRYTWPSKQRLQQKSIKTKNYNTNQHLVTQGRYVHGVHLTKNASTTEHSLPDAMEVIKNKIKLLDVFSK